MRWKIPILIIIGWLVLSGSLAAQYKTERPATYQQMCFYVIDKAKFEDYKTIKNQLLEEKDYSSVAGILRKMRNDLKQFELSKHNRAFELWYIGNYTDFEQQVETAKESTLAFLKNYETRIRNKKALYYDHRMFLEHCLAYQTAYFYPDFWFMSMERYFALKTVERVTKSNAEGEKLFKNSEFYRPFDIFNDLAASEEKDIKDYLDMDKFILDTTTFIPYSYVALNQPNASYILANFELDDATQDIDTDRQITALKKMLEAVAENKVLLVARLNLMELRRFMQQNKTAKTEQKDKAKEED